MNSPDKDQAGAGTSPSAAAGAAGVGAVDATVQPPADATAQPPAGGSRVDPVVVPATDAATRTVSVARISPLSALKVGAGFAVTLFLVWMVAVAIVWFGLQQAGVWDRLNNLLADLFGLNSFSAGLFFGLAAVLGALEVLVVVLLAPLAAIVYNNAERLFGGLKIELQ